MKEVFLVTLMIVLVSGLILSCRAEPAPTPTSTPAPPNENIPDLEDSFQGPMVSIPSGSFQMGTNRYFTGFGNRPVHKVTLDAFEMSATEVTNAQYAAYLNAALAAGEITVRLGDAGGMGTRIFTPVPAYEVIGATGKYAGMSYMLLSPVAGLGEHPLNRNWIEYAYDGSRFTVAPGRENWPVNFVRWYGAYVFAEHYGMSLPTEAEWEYAARGGLQYEYPTDDGTISCEKANYSCQVMPGPSTSPDYIGHIVEVGSYPLNPFGLYDMAGNVWEWCMDWYDADYYSRSPTNNPVNLEGEEPPQDGSATGGPTTPYSHDTRVVRGGSYNYFQATTHCAYRNKTYPFRGNDHFGFRVARR